MIPQDRETTHARPDFARVEPTPRFLPHCTEPRIVAMGLSPMDGPWLDTDPTQAWRDHKLKLRGRHGDNVYTVLPECTAAATEFAALVMNEARVSNTDTDEPLWSASLTVADDLVVMLPDDKGDYRLSAASLCSPSDWRLEEKLGLTMSEVHRPIPRLNREIGGQIDRFFARLPRDRSIQRFNWSLTPHPDHMSRDTWQVAPNSSALWYRAERQSLRRLPQTGAIAFTIRVHVCPLIGLAEFDGALQDLWQAIDGATADLRRYKGLDELRPVIDRWRAANQV